MRPKQVQFRSDLVGFCHYIVWHYLLVSQDEVVAIDVGFGGAYRQVVRWFEQSGRPSSHLKAIILTHGHFDHAGCVQKLSDWSGAPVYLHPDDLAIARQTMPYKGWSRVGGVMERAGKLILGHDPPRATFPIVDGMDLPFWGGLRAVGLPGHTPGHVAIYAAAKRLIFSADAVLVYGSRCVFPHRIFNVDHTAVRQSVVNLASLDAEWVYPSHHVGLQHNILGDIRQYASKRAAARAP